MIPKIFTNRSFNLTLWEFILKNNHLINKILIKSIVIFKNFTKPGDKKLCIYSPEKIFLLPGFPGIISLL